MRKQILEIANKIYNKLIKINKIIDSILFQNSNSNNNDLKEYMKENLLKNKRKNNYLNFI